MKIVVAPNAYKGSLTGSEAAAAMGRGIQHVLPEAEIVEVPVADGGDGLVDVVHGALGGELRKVLVSGPLRNLVEAEFCVVAEKGLASIEMALASGLALVNENERDPEKTSTYGTGELIREALDLGLTRIGIGIGGSATNDGGIGMAAALGVRFLDIEGKRLEPVGGSLGRIAHIDMNRLDARIAHTRIEAICDVDNPLTGPKGASRVYGPQKGASPKQVERLEAGLANLARVIKNDLGFDVAGMAGGGAAGGLGAGLFVFLGAELRPGVAVVLELVGLAEKMAGAELVLTGEGQIDFQTVFGKAPAGVAALAKEQGIPCIAIAGSIGDDLGGLHHTGLTAVFSLCPGPVTLQEAMTKGADLLSRATEQVLRAYLAGATAAKNRDRP
jgi:glycerate kinase